MENPLKMYDAMYQKLLTELEKKPENVQQQVHQALQQTFENILKQLEQVR